MLDPTTVEPRTGSSYPLHLSMYLKGRSRRLLGSALGLRNFGVNLLRFEPGSWSSQRQWHLTQDEFIYVFEGEVVLITDEGERVLGPGMTAGSPAGAANGHRLVNWRGGAVLEVGDRSPGDVGVDPDIDMQARMKAPAYEFTRKDGSSF